jgi:hypothetical protein
MKRIVLLVIVLAMTLSLSSKENSPLEFPTHEIYSQFAGEWTMIYANIKDGETLASGRGISTSKLDMRNTILEFRNEFEHKIGKVVSKYVIGFDVQSKGYYLITYSSANEAPIVMFGKYNKDEKNFVFYSNKDTKLDGNIKAVLKKERDDKVVFKSFILLEGKEELFLNVGFVRE